MSIWRYLFFGITITGKLMSWKGIDECFSYYDMYESGVTSSGDRKHQYQRTDIMICQSDVSPVSTTRFALSHPRD